MIKRSKQNWESGSVVKVGFMQLRVVQAIPTPGDYMPDAYILANLQSTKLYKFVPHNGLESIDLLEANEMIASAVQIAAACAQNAINTARQAIDINKLIAA